jgi:hypothetical protein
MKNISALHLPFLALSAALLPATPLHAADTIETPWSNVCKMASGKQLVFTTADGATVEGYCVRINADEMGVRTLDARTITIARTALSTLRLRRFKGHQLHSLGTGLRAGLRRELDWLLSPMAPLGLVSIPTTIAWSAASAPFCMLGDLVNKLTPEQDIKVLADSVPKKNNP